MPLIYLVLGASDPEMDEIERIARKAGCSVGYATREGQRVGQETAYQADGVEGIDLVAACDTADLIMVVECAPGQDCTHAGWIKTGLVPGRNGDCSDRVVRVDHHRPVDPGYGKPPKEFLAASSVGQTIAHLARCGALERVVRWHSVEDYPSHAWVWCGDPHPPPGSLRLTHPDAGIYDLRGALAYGVTWVRSGWVVVIHQWGEAVGAAKYRGSAWIPRSYVLAAADHCLAAAYRGECPGVDPDELGRWRIAVLAEQQGRSEANVLADVERARAALRAAPKLCLVSDPEVVEVADMRGQNIPELLEAAAREGICFVAFQTDSNGHTKIVCQVGSPAQIQAFQTWAKTQGFVDIYGDPAQGFAGGYLSHE
jgi:hypothetical protein